jgi:hypothetical protein
VRRWWWAGRGAQGAGCGVLAYKISQRVIRGVKGISSAGLRVQRKAICRRGRFRSPKKERKRKKEQRHARPYNRATMRDGERVKWGGGGGGRKKQRLCVVQMFHPGRSCGAYGGGPPPASKTTPAAAFLLNIIHRVRVSAPRCAHTYTDTILPVPPLSRRPVPFILTRALHFSSRALAPSSGPLLHYTACAELLYLAHFLPYLLPLALHTSFLAPLLLRPHHRRPAIAFLFYRPRRD